MLKEERIKEKGKEIKKENKKKTIYKLLLITLLGIYVKTFNKT